MVYLRELTYLFLSSKMKLTLGNHGDLLHVNQSILTQYQFLTSAIDAFDLRKSLYIMGQLLMKKKTCLYFLDEMCLTARQQVYRLKNKDSSFVALNFHHSHLCSKKGISGILSLHKMFDPPICCPSPFPHPTGIYDRLPMRRKEGITKSSLDLKFEFDVSTYLDVKY